MTSEAALSLEQRQIMAYGDIVKSRQGVKVVDGKIAENLRADAARRMLQKAQMITELDTAGT